VSAEAIEKAITPRTKLIIPVHFAGAPLDLDPIRAVAAKHNIPVVEDAAHVLGTQYKGREVGSDGGDAIFSLQAIKNVTSAEGGVFVTNNESLANHLKRLKFHGLGVDAFDRTTHGRSPQAEVIEPGFKYNLPDMCAVLALNQLKRLETINSKRRAIAEFYLKAFKDVPEVSPLHAPRWEHHHAWHLFVIRLNDISKRSRNDFIEAMKAQQIGCGIHFRAIHQQKYYREHFPQVSLPNTEWNSDRICSIPLFPDMTLADAGRVVSAITSIVRAK
jgi:UDP-4-amino-4-deoxy-L-arabinose-oxoglutarate aminotransferase